MSFLSPWWLLALVVPVVLLVVFGVSQSRRRGYAVRLADLDLLDEVAPDRPGWRRWLPVAFFTLALVALVVALARPAIERPVVEERASVILAMDVSLSMAAQDVDPDRITTAKDAAVEFLADLPEGLRVGLVAFSGSAQPLVPPTTDRSVLSSAVRGLRLGEGTAIGEAIFSSLELITADREQVGDDAPGTIIILSDGETTMGRPDAQAVAAANEAGVAVSTIAFGTESGFVTVEGQVVPVPVDAAALDQIAEVGGGVAFEALDAGELLDAFGDLGGSVGRTTEDREIGNWFLAAGLFIAAAAAVTSIIWFSRLP